MTTDMLPANEHAVAHCLIPDSVFPFVTCEPSLTAAQLLKPGGLMSKAIRTILSLVVSLVLLSALTMAQTGGNNADKNKDKDKEHHSRFAKVAFWRHNKDADKNAKPGQAAPVPSKPVQAKTAQVKPASAKQVAGKNSPKAEQHASHMSKPSVKKAPAASKTKAKQKAQDPKAASLKQ